MIPGPPHDQADRVELVALGLLEGRLAGPEAAAVLLELAGAIRVDRLARQAVADRAQVLVTAAALEVLDLQARLIELEADAAPDLARG